MAQGKKYDKDKVMEALKPFFKLGCSIPKACAYAGIKYETVWRWLKDEEELLIKVTAWQNEINEAARRTWKQKIQSGDYQAAKDWMSKREKDDFSDRQEVTGKDGEEVVKGFNYILPTSIEVDPPKLDNDSDSSTST